MYYRVAIQLEEVPAWKWKSSALESFNVLLKWLQHFRVLPAGRLRIFSSTSAEALRTLQVPAEDQSLWATSVPLPQFLLERGLARAHEAGTAAGSPEETAASAGAGARDVGVATPCHECAAVLGPIGSIALERQREKLEEGTGGDHDCPHHFSFPPSLPELHTWVWLWERVQHGDLRPEVTNCYRTSPE